MNDRRRIILEEDLQNVVTIRITTTDGTTNVGISMTVTNDNNVYLVTTDSNGKVEITGLSGGCTIDCTTHILSVYQFTATSTMTVDINAYVETFPLGDVRTYGYTGSYSTVKLTPGQYNLQVWGAQGGSNAAASSYSITAKDGGRGGYSEGQLTISSTTDVRVYVGGQGTSSSGGYNGGGSTTGSSSYNASNEQGVSRMGGGGGATDIRLSDGALLSRMIVAGGGAGGAMCFQSKTTSSTTWESYGSGSDDGRDLTWSDYHYRESKVFSISTGYTYRIKVTVSSSTNLQRTFLQFWNSSNSDISKTEVTAGSWTTFTVPSNATGMYVKTAGYPGTASPSPTYSFTVQKQTTTSSTSTSTDYQVGGVGGGTQGGGYSSSYVGKQNAAGSGGSFGQGADQSVTNYRYCSGAGGGGWYGGGGGSYSDSTMTNCKYSGGGSGWVNTSASAGNRPSGYTGLQLDSGTTYSGSSSFPNTAGTGTETGHAGNGYAKITKVSYLCNITLRFNNYEDNQPITGVNVTLNSSDNTYNFTTDSNGEITSIMGSGTYNVYCEGYSLNTTSITFTRDTIFTFAGVGCFDFSYTGSEQTKTLDAGTYKIECWGAQGGSYNTSYIGGKGGYSVGELTLTEQTTLYIMVGGQGTGNTSTGIRSGGWNGGGGAYTSSTTYANGSGGGASDVRIGQNSLYARVIVAGGGGGAGSYSSSYRYSGGAGGGTTGVTPSQYSTSYRAGTGGSQTAAGTSYYSSTANSTTYGNLASFGTGASYKSTSYAVTGGGGGWYGGGYSFRGAAGGGSGYVYNSSTASNYPSGCLLNSSYYLDESQTIAGNASMPSTSGGTETGHEGNGFVRISKIITNTVTLHFETDGEPLEDATITVTKQT